MTEFSRLHPAVTVELGLDDRFVDLIEKGDVAIRTGRLRDSTMITRKIAPCRLLVCGSPSYLAERGVPEGLTDLSRHNCLGHTLSRGVGPHEWAFRLDGKVKVSVRGNLRANNGDALVAASIPDQGLIYQPTFLVSGALREGRLMALPLDHPRLSFRVSSPCIRPVAIVLPRHVPSWTSLRSGSDPTRSGIRGCS